ncbi:hypothetical protein [Fodinicola acaciae]|uniref:hypothetical protein n=1 Tax=Fodinicola acaciae TaxID=2681555 RepID=UPI0013D699A3|nr:hypothetical protein [Fodinicola acaciae]
MTDPGGFAKSGVIGRYGQKKPSFWQRLKKAPVVGTAIGTTQAWQKKMWFELLGRVSAIGTVAGVSMTVVPHLPPAAQAIVIGVLSTGAPAGALGSANSEGLKTAWDTWRKNHRARKETKPVPEPAVDSVERRLSRLETADMDMRLNNAAVLAELAKLREQNTALQQSNHAVRSQNVELFDENAQLRDKVASLWEVVQAHSVILKGQESQLADHDKTLGRQDQSLTRHDSALAGHGETLLGHENRLNQHEAMLRRPPEPPTGPPPQPTPPSPDPLVDAQQAWDLNAKAHESLARTKKQPEEESLASFDPNYFLNPRIDPNQGPQR